MSITKFIFCGGYRSLTSITNFILLGRLSLIKISKCWEVNGLTSITKFKLLGGYRTMEVVHGTWYMVVVVIMGCDWVINGIGPKP